MRALSAPAIKPALEMVLLRRLELGRPEHRGLNRRPALLVPREGLDSGLGESRTWVQWTSAVGWTDFILI